MEQCTVLKMWTHPTYSLTDEAILFPALIFWGSYIFIC